MYPVYTLFVVSCIKPSQHNKRAECVEKSTKRFQAVFAREGSRAFFENESNFFRIFVFLSEFEYSNSFPCGLTLFYTCLNLN